MTDEELRNLVGELAVSTKELRESQRLTDEQLRLTSDKWRAEWQASMAELRESQRLTAEQLRLNSAERRESQKLTEEQLRLTSDKWREEWQTSMAELRESQRLTEEQVRLTSAELRTSIAEMRLSTEELKESQKKTERLIKQTNKQIGEMGRKMGAYTEGMAEQSLLKIFSTKFKLEFSATNVRRSRNGNSIELDMLGYSNSKQNMVVVAEIKSSFSDEDFQQVIQTLAEFPKFFPEHADKQLYGIVAAVNIPENMRHKLWKNGIYLATLGREVFTLRTPENFQPKQYNPNLGLAE